MSSSHPNAVAYRRTADAFRASDRDKLLSLIAPDVVWHVPGSHPMAGDIRGRDALVAWLDRLPTRGFWLTELDVFGSDEHVCALSTMGARRDGVDAQTRVVSFFVYRDGCQLERWFYPDDLDAWDSISPTDCSGVLSRVRCERATPRCRVEPAPVRIQCRDSRKCYPRRVTGTRHIP